MPKPDRRKPTSAAGRTLVAAAEALGGPARGE
jgi:hypothetical protein